MTTDFKYIMAVFIVCFTLAFCVFTISEAGKEITKAGYRVTFEMDNNSLEALKSTLEYQKQKDLAEVKE